MSHSRVTRRVFLAHGLAASGIAFLAPTLLACGGEELSCSDLTGLDDTQKTTRQTLQYVEASPHGEAKMCANCRFYTAAQRGCGSCQLVAGPINPKGYCNSWAALG
jgi:hypothetical protein